MGEENSALGISMRLFQNPEIDELMKSTDGETADKLLAGTRKILETLIGRCG